MILTPSLRLRWPVKLVPAFRKSGLVAVVIGFASCATGFSVLPLCWSPPSPFAIVGRDARTGAVLDHVVTMIERDDRALAAAVAYGVNTMFGPQPRACLFEYGTVLFNVPWLVALSLISACATFWARRTGASVFRRILVAVSPALVMGGMVTGLMAVVVAAARANGHHVYPLDAIGHFLIGWILVPAAVALVGALPFLGSDRTPHRRQ